MTPRPAARLAPSSGTSPAPLACPVCGLNVSSLPLPSTTVHCCTDGHDTDETPLTVAESSDVPPAAPTCPVTGLKVTSVSPLLPPPPAAVHWVAEAHETAPR